ncbi:MAG: DUF6519 domain-containing protein [Anaerolineae bacterium]
MKGDFTRVTFKSVKHYSGVRMQQGRVLLDADFNEYVDIQAHLNQTEAKDVIGPCGAPQDNAGFEIGVTPDGGDLTIAPGRIYVDGILCQLEEMSVPVVEFLAPDQVRVDTLHVNGHQFAGGDWVEVSGAGSEPQLARIAVVEPEEQILTFEETLTEPEGEGEARVRLVTTYSTQPDYPDPDPVLDAEDLTSGLYLAYLDVWQRHLTALEDDSIREVALGGPDTTTRTRTVWQVKLLHAGDADNGPLNCASELAAWQEATAHSSGQLRARAEPETTETDPCVVPARAGYRGLENQLYRVEVHRVVSDTRITIKWSRENGSVVARWDKQDSQDANKLTVSSAGRDEVLGFAPDDWIELTDDTRELHGQPGLLVQITKVDGKVLTINPGAATVDINDFAPTRKVRRWDMPSDTGEIIVNLTETDNWIELENGIEVAFEPGTYRTGDYWLIPARTATRDIEWPRAGNVALPQSPHGIHHHYCRLAVLSFDGTIWERIHDCRKLFPPLTEMVRFFYISGDGQEAMPGDPLPKPLQVGVVNGQTPVAGAKVAFQVVDGSGHLQESAAPSCSTFTSGGTESIEVETDLDGIAACCWRLDNSTLSQQVEATLLEIDGKPMVDGDGTPFLTPIRFNANLSVAKQVHYDSEQCINPAKPDTVQDALDQLCRNAALHYVSGDGQEAQPGDKLPRPLQVRVANGQWPVKGEVVVFQIVEPGKGILKANGESGELVRAETDETGLAICEWQLDEENQSQQVEAFLEKAEHLPIRFSANLSVAREVAYDPGECPRLQEAGVGTVQEAIDQLCKLGVDEEPGIHIEKVELSDGTALKNDSRVPVGALAKGIQVVCDQVIAPESVTSKPACFVTLDLPYPLTSADAGFWSFDNLIGYQPLKLAAQVSARDQDIFWVPDKDTKTWLQTHLFKRLSVDQILAHLTLKGNFIWARENPELYLDGEAFGIRRDSSTNTDLHLPSGDGRRGGDFEMWFWLVEKPREAVGIGLIPNNASEVLSIHGARNASSLAIDREALRVALPPDYQVDITRPFDPEKAKGIVAELGLGGSQLSAVVGDSLSQTAGLLAEMLQENADLGLELTIVPGLEVVEAVITMGEAGQLPDMVIGDENLAKELANVLSDNFDGKLIRF